MVKCAVLACQNDSRTHNKTKHNITFHRFPKNEKVKQKWTKIMRDLGYEPDWLPNDQSRVCSEHFEQEDLADSKRGLRFIKPNAIPVLKLTSWEDKPRRRSSPLRACRACLASGVRLHKLESGSSLGSVYTEVVGRTIGVRDKYPRFICSMCKHVLLKCQEFRQQCHVAANVLRHMEKNNTQININTLRKIQPKPIFKLTQTKIDITSFTEASEDVYVNNYGDQHKIKIEEGTSSHFIIDNVTSKEENIISNDDEPIKSEYLINENTGLHKVEVIDTMFVETRENYNNSDEFNDSEWLELSDNEEKIKKTPVTKRKITQDSDNEKNTSDSKKKKNKDKSDSKIMDPETSRVNIEELNDEKSLMTAAILMLGKITRLDRKMSISDIWQIVYEQSLLLEESNDSVISETEPWKLHMIDYMKIVKKLCKLYDADVTFISKEEALNEIERLRCSTKYTDASYKCEYCCKLYNTQESYDRHMISHDPAMGTLECEVCHYRFDKRKLYLKHYQTFHTRRITCNKCGARFRHWHHSKKHHQWHGGATYPCRYCGKTYANKDLYISHAKFSHRDKVAVTLCLLCGGRFNGRAGLKVHRDMSHRKGARCDKCRVLFRDEAALSTHALDGCPNSESPCPWCGVNFTSEESMKEHHELTHSMDYPDPKIPVPKSRDSALRKARNEKINVPAKDLICETCGRGNFRCYAMLRYHQRTHTGERPYGCELCGKRFGFVGCYRTHMLTHTKERPYKCPFCPKTFRQSSHRAAHLVTHTKERPYACANCDKRYTSSGSLREHVEIVHHGKPPRRRGRRADGE